jgi:hypothetical protein
MKNRLREWEKRKKYLEFTKWEKVKVIFSIKGYEEEVKRMCQRTGGIIFLTQTHSDNVIWIKTNKFFKTEGDGLLTSLKGVWLGIRVADCLGVYIYDSFHKIIGIIHAGRRGTENNIVKKGLKKIKEKIGDISNVELLFSPSICHVCYFYDLWSNNTKQAKEMKVKKIINPKVCTKEYEDLFYSYHSTKTSKRMIAGIKLLP